MSRWKPTAREVRREEHRRVEDCATACAARASITQDYVLGLEAEIKRLRGVVRVLRHTLLLVDVPCDGSSPEKHQILKKW